MIKMRSGIFIVSILAVCAIMVLPASAANTTSFTWEQGTNADYLTVYFTGAVGLPNVTSWSWDFGDGSTASGQSPSHTYSSVNSYTVRLTTTFSDQPDDMAEDLVALEEPVLTPCFTASATSGGAPLTVTFTDITAGTHDFTWDFGDGTSTDSTQSTVSHTFASPNTYTVTLTVNRGEASNSTEKSISVIYPTPTALFTSNVTSGDVPLGVKFTDQSTVSYGNITAWSWNFGDGNTSTLQNPENVFPKTGNYTVSLTVTAHSSPNFKYNTITETGYIQVTSGLTASFTGNVTTGDNPLSVKFTSTTPSDLTIDSYHWDFGDGSTSDDANPVHTYNFLGEYDVTLIVTDNGGETYTLSKTDYIKVENPVTATATTATPTATTAQPTYVITETETPDLTVPAVVQNGTKIFGIPGTEFFRSETVRFHGLYKEWIILLKGLFGMS
ncbi:MAG: PKD domain-containing protein [Methanomicrobiaceae archaeon]|nr:PKD domain-containing protein [Methanomicrobiaceae archaeon]